MRDVTRDEDETRSGSGARIERGVARRGWNWGRFEERDRASGRAAAARKRRRAEGQGPAARRARAEIAFRRAPRALAASRALAAPRSSHPPGGVAHQLPTFMVVRVPFDVGATRAPAKALAIGRAAESCIVAGCEARRIDRGKRCEIRAQSSELEPKIVIGSCLIQPSPVRDDRAPSTHSHRTFRHAPTQRWRR